MSLLDEVRGGTSDEGDEKASGKRELDRIERQLVEEYGASLEPSVVSMVFRTAVAAFDGATVQLYVPLLSERVARRRIHDLLAQPRIEQTEVAARLVPGTSSRHPRRAPRWLSRSGA